MFFLNNNVGICQPQICVCVSSIMDTHIIIQRNNKTKIYPENKKKICCTCRSYFLKLHFNLFCD